MPLRCACLLPSAVQSVHTLTCASTADGREVYMADEAYDEVKGVPEVSAVCCSRRPALGSGLTVTAATPGTRG